MSTAVQTRSMFGALQLAKPTKNLAVSNPSSRRDSAQHASANADLFAPKAVKFTGLHPDAVIGADIQLRGMAHPQYADELRKTNSAILMKLKRQDGLTPFTHLLKKPEPVRLVRQPNNSFDPNAIVVQYEESPGQWNNVGFIPKPVIAGLAPLMDKGYAFAGFITKLSAYKNKANQWEHNVDARIELISTLNRAPDMTIAQEVDTAFSQARKTQLNSVLTILPEKVVSHPMRGGKALIERVNYEQAHWGEATFFWDNQLIARIALDPTQPIEPTFLVPKLPKTVQEKVCELVNTELGDVCQHQTKGTKLDKTA